MATKTINARLSLLVKSYSEWQAIKDTFIPMNGEVCLVRVPADTGALAQEPCTLFKTGDGVHTFGELPYSSALAADVYAWAKKANLDWTDLDNTFKAQLEEFIEQHSTSIDTLYQIVSDGDYKWKLQKSVDNGDTWVDATGSIDVSDLETRIAALETEIAKKVDKDIVSAEGKARIFNEADGGGAKFEGANGYDSFAGVNSDTKDGIGAQLYDINRATKKGSKLDVTANGMYYTKGEKSGLTPAERDVEANELATKGDIEALPELRIAKLSDAGEYAARYQLQDEDGTSYGDTINIPKDYLVKDAKVKVVEVDDDPYPGAKVGDKYIDFTINVKEGTGTDTHIYIPVKDLVDPYTAGDGIVIDDQNVISIDPAFKGRVDDLETDLAAETAAREAEDTAIRTELANKTDYKVTGTNGDAYMFNERDGGGSRFVNNDGTEAFVGVNDGGENGLMAQIYADKNVNGQWVGSRLSAYHDKFYYVNKAARAAGVANNDAAHEIAVKKDLETKIDEEDLLIINCNV